MNRLTNSLPESGWGGGGGRCRGGENGSLDVQEVGEEFPVTISPADDKKSFYLKGWGGDRNKFRDFAIKMDFEPAEDNYHKIGISFPQDIETEGDIVWKYVSWYNFVGTVGKEKG